MKVREKKKKVQKERKKEKKNYQKEYFNWKSCPSEMKARKRLFQTNKS